MDNSESSLRSPEREFPRADAQPQTSGPVRILIVDDDASSSELITQLLIKSGYEVDTAGDGAAAWDTLQRNDYDLMVTDNSMPRMSGLDLLKKLRFARMALPVIMATGAPPYEEFARQPWLRPAGLLSKPYTIAELLGTVQKVLRESGPTPGPVAG